MPRQRLDDRLTEMIKRYCEGEASSKEIEFIDQYYEGFRDLPEILKGKSKDEIAELDSDMFQNILKKTQRNSRQKGRFFEMKTWYKITAAASILFILSLAFFLTQPSTKQNTEEVAVKNRDSDLSPGGNKAILTLSDGTEIILDSMSAGILSTQGDANVIKLDDGQLAYNLSEKKEDREIVFNTVSTPRGGQYQLVLSDGTKVWLNAASSLRFPASFNGQDRKVELTGEGYFEVAANKNKPFKVFSNNMEVTALGTQFNINTYTDESAMTTTLLEGSVRVDYDQKSILLVPGEQALIGDKGSGIVVSKDSDLNATIAWKKGIFHFAQADIRTIMRELSRWYDMEVVFEDKVPDTKFDGKIYRNVNASEVFRILEAGGIEFTIIGKKVIVQNNKNIRK